MNDGSLPSLTPPTVAKQIGVSVSTVLSWIKSGELRAIDVSSKTSSRPLYKTSSQWLAEFIERRTVNPRTEMRRRQRETGYERHV